MLDNNIPLDICKALRPNTSRAFNVLRQGKINTFKMAPAIRRYAYERGVSFKELIDLSQNESGVTKYDIDRYLERKKIFAKQQIKTKIHNEIDKAAMQKALLDINQKEVSAQRIIIEETEDDEPIKTLNGADQSVSIELPEISEQNDLNITPMALALAEIEKISLNELKSINESNKQITLNALKKWIAIHRITETPISPLAQKMIDEYHIQDTELPKGSGANGQIISMDIYKWLQSQPHIKDDSIK